MTVNIMNEYIDLTKKQILTYFKTIFEKKFEKKYVEAFIDKYVNTRFYNFFGGIETRTLRRTILEEIKKTQDELIYNNIQDKELIEYIHVFFCYVLYFDDVVYCKDLKTKMQKIEKIREKYLEKKDDDFVEKLYKEITSINIEKEMLLDKFKTDDFYLQITNYKNKINTYKVSLKYDLKFPMEYSRMAINKVFNTGLINEDKLVVEYYLIVVQIIRDVIKQNFKRQYIVDFASTLFKKSKKIKNILNAIDNAAIQDKISLKIRYEEFIENKNSIYELMREGYRFSIVLDNSFEVNYKNIENLKMFKYILISTDSKNYQNIIKLGEEIENNIIEI